MLSAVEKCNCFKKGIKECPSDDRSLKGIFALSGSVRKKYYLGVDIQYYMLYSIANEQYYTAYNIIKSKTKER